MWTERENLCRVEKKQVCGQAGGNAENGAFVAPDPGLPCLGEHHIPEPNVHGRKRRNR